ncbi:hypothetical protein Tco_0730638 [Tanacetum coccineum]|uniref:Uncharacterized protein n=1 Tax=Tanacetum coccineum TaxID=301880 RepID=A0ABQ4YV51_9ASTR
MRDPDPKNPSLVPPPRGTDDVIKPKCITRSDLKKELDDMEYEDDISEDLEDKDEEFEVRYEDIGDSNVFEGVGVNKGKENEVNRGFDGVGMGSDVGVKISKVVDQVSVKENMLRNVGSLDQGSGDRVNSVWPRLNEVNEKGSGSNGDGRNVKGDSTNGRKPLFFISDIQGMSSSGSNKLSRIPVKMNDKGVNVVDIDPIIEEGSKKRELTNVFGHWQPHSSEYAHEPFTSGIIGMPMPKNLTMKADWRPPIILNPQFHRPTKDFRKNIDKV